MTEKRGRCTNLEFCSNATQQRIVAVADGESFVCPKCQEPLEALRTAPPKPARNRGIMIAVQAAVIVLGGGIVGYKLLNGTLGESAPIGGNTSSGNTISGNTLGGNTLGGNTLGGNTLGGNTLGGNTGMGGQAVVGQRTPAPAPALLIAPRPAVALAPAPAATILLRMAGSDVLGGRLARRLASGYLALIGDADLQTEAAGGVTSVIGNQAGERESIAITVGNSASGFTALLRGTADLALAVRPPTKAEMEKFAGIANLTSPANEHVVAVQPILAVVSPANRLAAISTAQLRAVLTGQLTDWAQLGGSAGPIHLVVGDDKAATVDTAATGLIGDAPLSGQARRVASEIELAQAVGADPQALGLVAGGHEGGARIVPITAADGSAVLPNEINVATEDYPLTRRLYLYSAKVSDESAMRRFVAYAGSEAGQAAVAAAGFTTLTVRAAAVVVPVTASDRFRRLVAGASRVSIDFRFLPGSTTLDSRSTPDVERLVTYLRAQRANGSRLILAGFADGSGNSSNNLAVSQRRVDTVVSALVQAGVIGVRAANFGAELPVADNATADGREKNRRVEVYLAP